MVYPPPMVTRTAPWLNPVTLTGAQIRLEPLCPSHAAALADAVQDGELWRLWYTSVPEPAGMANEIARRLALQAAGSMLPFTVFEPVSGDAVGMTSFMHCDAAHKRVEIGSTWYAKRVQRTGLNTGAKLLLLTHAFETLSCIAVEFRTHVQNQQSRRAIERLGAKLDGVLRHHQVLKDGSLRDTAVYSILQAEWPTVRKNLSARRKP
jgi:RimJ/RimL family protein N-acetyltransferase